MVDLDSRLRALGDDVAQYISDPPSSADLRRLESYRRRCRIVMLLAVITVGVVLGGGAVYGATHTADREPSPLGYPTASASQTPAVPTASPTPSPTTRQGTASTSRNPLHAPPPTELTDPRSSTNPPTAPSPPAPSPTALSPSPSPSPSPTPSEAPPEAPSNTPSSNVEPSASGPSIVTPPETPPTPTPEPPQTPQ